MTRGGWTVLVAAIAFVAAVVGVFVGRALLPAPPSPSTELHELLHQELDLDAAQKARLEQLESSYALRRTTIEAAMRADNARLAEAIEAEHGYGPAVAAAVDASHADMGRLQKATLAHVFAMRQILRPDQEGRYDRAVVKALTADQK
ncbi:MAG: periplasmic heavy metal sensor [Bosea sp. (in: a-proteobacteria)]|uniref:periplasmic heavy metal sensor n=1 Tax=Bosea sp. (in: a-proteobacteria) TaxID=1871050 RepID=UPI003F7BD8E2